MDIALVIHLAIFGCPLCFPKHWQSEYITSLENYVLREKFSKNWNV